MNQKSKRQVTLGTFMSNSIVPTVSSKVHLDSHHQLQEQNQDSFFNQQSSEKLFYQRNSNALPTNVSADDIKVEDLEDMDTKNELVISAEVHQENSPANVTNKANLTTQEIDPPMSLKQFLNTQNSNHQEEDLIEIAPIENEAETQEITFKSNPFLYIKNHLTHLPLNGASTSLRDLLKATWQVNAITIFIMVWLTPNNIHLIYNSINNVSICDYQPGIASKIETIFMFFSSLLFPILVKHKLKYF